MGKWILCYECRSTSIHCVQSTMKFYELASVITIEGVKLYRVATLQLGTVNASPIPQMGDGQWQYRLRFILLFMFNRYYICDVILQCLLLMLVCHSILMNYNLSFGFYHLK